MKRWSRVAVTALTALVTTFLEGAKPPLVQVDNKPDPRIEVVPLDDSHRSLTPKSLHNLSLPMPPGSFILVNHRGTPITALDVRWTYTSASGELKQRAITCDAYEFAPLEPIVDANDVSLITPYGCTKPNLFSRLEGEGVIGGSPLLPGASVEMSVDPGATLHLYLDSVIFQDGQILGPDKFHYYKRIQERYVAVQRFVAEVEAGRIAGADLGMLLADIRNDEQGKRHEHSSWPLSRRAYYAGLLLRSPNPEGTLGQLKAQVAPPTFSHEGEAKQ